MVYVQSEFRRLRAWIRAKSLKNHGADSKYQASGFFFKQSFGEAFDPAVVNHRCPNARKWGARFS